MGLQANIRFSMRIRRLNIGRWLVVLVLVEKIVEVEVVKDTVVVVSQMIKVKIEGVGEREDPVLKHENI